MNNNNLLDKTENGETTPKKRRDHGYTVKVNEADNERFIRHNMSLYEIGINKLDPADVEMVRDRARKYFEACVRDSMKPTVPGFALACGIHRATLWRWATGEVKQVSPEVQAELERVYMVLNAQMEDYMHEGKIHPYIGMFLSKNHFGYLDQKQITVASTDPLGEKVDENELREKYMDIIETSGELEK